MIVDCHTHITGAGQSSEAEHLSVAETVDACVVLASSENPHEQANKNISEYVGKYKGKMVGFAVVDPTEDGVGVESLRNVTERQDLSGLVLYCAQSGFHPAHSRAMRLYESAEQLYLPIFFHNSGGFEPGAILDYAQPYLLDEVARNFPSLKFVVGGMGIPFLEQTLSLIGKHENVYADLSIQPKSIWQVYNMVVSAYERGVMNKLLFGSGFPNARADECIETLLGFNKLLSEVNLPIVPRDKIRGIIERDTLGMLGISR